MLKRRALINTDGMTAEEMVEHHRSEAVSRLKKAETGRGKWGMEAALASQATVHALLAVSAQLDLLLDASGGATAS